MRCFLHIALTNAMMHYRIHSNENQMFIYCEILSYALVQ